MALTKASLSRGLVKNSSAPAFIACTGDEDDWHSDVFSYKLFLQFKAVQARKREVEYKTARDALSRMVEKFLCGGERLRLPVLIPDQQFQGFAHGNIIVNNEHDR